MKQLLRNSWFYIGLVYLITMVLLFADNSIDDEFIRQEEEKLGHQLEEHLLIKKKESFAIFQDPGFETAVRNRDLSSSVLKTIGKKNFYLMAMQGDSLQFWNSNQVILDSGLINDREICSIRNFGKRTLLICRREVGPYQCYLIYIAGNTSGNLTLPSDHPFNTGNAYVYDITESGRGYEMHWDDGRRMASFNLIDIIGTGKNTILVDVFFILLITFLLFRFVELNNEQGMNYRIFGVIAVTILLLRTLLYKKWLLASLKNTELFNPEIYASSFLLPSLGDLILHLFGFLGVFYAFTRIRHRGFLYIPGTRYSWIKAFVLVAGLAFFTDLVFSIIKSLVVDSNISFHFADLPKINVYSFLGMTVIGILMGGLFYTAGFFFRASGFRFLGTKTIWSATLTALVVYAVFQEVNGHLNRVSIFTTVVMALLLITWFVMHLTIRDFYLNILILLTISGFSAFIINFQNKRHELEYVNVFVNRIISNQDLEAESKFAEMEQELVKEFITPQDFQNFFRRQDEYEKRIKNLFFSGYLDKFELKVLSFDSLGRSMLLDNRFSYRYLDHLYGFESYPTISNHFYQIKNKAGTRGYIAKFETCNLEGSFGTVFLLLQPKIIQSSHSYPDILDDKKQQRAFEFKDYSYAIYQDGKLVSQKGDYPYRLAISGRGDETGEEGLFSLSGYKHFINYPGPGTMVIVSKRQDYLVKSFALFSFMFIFFTTLGVLFAILWASLYIARFGWHRFTSRHRHNTPLLDLLSRTLPLISTRQRLLSSRIQMSMVGLVFFGLIVSVFFTIQYVRYNYNQRQQDQLYQKLKEILNQLENEPDLSRKLKSSDRLRALVNQLSDANRTDLNIFDEKGLLLASTQPGIYNQYLLAPVMHPEAYYQLRRENASQLLQNEQVVDFEYLSGYVPLFDDEGAIRAYLNLPYFTEKSEIDKEISSFLVSLINIYFLLLLIAIVIAYFIGQRISLPLQLIREKLSKTSISARNEIIEWRREDEIGQLVKQYNKMVIELEESAKKLSESEREGAWKEMARQVAHEIKNPLTPMKLNIQHLQRAWSSGNHESLDGTFKKVTAVLIEQIDNLSRLATEFSSFAQMPTDQFTNCRIDEILLSTIHLFERSENVEFVYNKDLAPVTVYADPGQLGRVFTNLLKNAIQSIPDDREGVIKIGYVIREGMVTVSVEDNGTGISQDIRAKIFVPSFSTKNSGMGLGLAISRKIAENCKGHIWFETELGKGSIFYVSLPVVSP